MKNTCQQTETNGQTEQKMGLKHCITSLGKRTTPPPIPGSHTQAHTEQIITAACVRSQTTLGRFSQVWIQMCKCSRITKNTPATYFTHKEFCFHT